MKPASMPGFENSSVIFILRQSQRNIQQVFSKNLYFCIFKSGENLRLSALVYCMEDFEGTRHRRMVG